jgi:hypothetical protein
VPKIGEELILIELQIILISHLSTQRVSLMEKSNLKNERRHYGN